MRGLLIASVVLAVGPYLFAQDEAASSRPISDAVDRAARDIWPIETAPGIDESGRAIFRSGVTVKIPLMPSPWQDQAAAPPIRLRGGIYHYEMLSMNTPEAFRSSTLYPIGITVDPGAMFNGVKSTWRAWQERRAHERVRKIVEELHAQNPD